MGHKVSPISFRIGISRDWQSRWFGGKKYKDFLQEDVAVRDFLNKKFKSMSVDHIDIERNPDVLSIAVHSARPGLIIGRGGTGAEEVKEALKKLIKRKTDIRLDVVEYKNPETSAKIMAESMAEQLEKRMPFRRLLKQTLAKIAAGRGVGGAKIMLSGRLDGADIARAEHLESGKLPLSELRANIDFARATAHTTFGTVGIKIWVYKEEHI